MLMLSFSSSILLSIVLFLPHSVVDARSPCFSACRSSSNCLHHDPRILKQNSKTFNIVSTLKDNDVYNNNRRITTSDHHLQRINQDQIISVVILLQRLRGGDIAGAAAAASSCKVNLLIESLDILGTTIFAFSGALKAGRKGMDLVGMMIIACITAVGGGTMRDILMMGGGEEHVVFWMQTPLYLEISLLTALVTFFLWPKIEAKFGLDADSAGLICTADALGLAAFCVVGVQAAAKRGLAPTLWVVSGLMTATFGGIIRDVICGDQPRVMYPHRTSYALGPALGALTYTVLDHLLNAHSWPLNSSSITLISFLVAFMVRVLSFNNPWRMPHWNVKHDE